MGKTRAPIEGVSTTSYSLFPIPYFLFAGW